MEQVKRQKYDWDLIISLLENGASRQSICKTFGISRSHLCSTLILFGKRDLGNRVKNRRIKPTPPPKPKFTCPIMTKIEVIKLLNKKISRPEIAEKLGIRTKDVDVIIASVRGKKCVS